MYNIVQTKHEDVDLNQHQSVSCGTGTMSTSRLDSVKGSVNTVTEKDTHTLISWLIMLDGTPLAKDIIQKDKRNQIKYIRKQLTAMSHFSRP